MKIFRFYRNFNVAVILSEVEESDFSAFIFSKHFPAFLFPQKKSGRKENSRTCSRGDKLLAHSLKFLLRYAPKKNFLTLISRQICIGALRKCAKGIRNANPNRFIRCGREEYVTLGWLMLIIALISKRVYS
jgi:hypothetical protein